MHKNERGDDFNIAIAETVSTTVRDYRSIPQTGNGNVGNVDRSMNIDVNSIEHDGVRISPSFMEFKDACEGMTFRQMFVIQNMGKHIAHVRICAPNSIAFQIETLSGGVFLSPGLKILRWVHYSYKRTSVLHAMIPIYVNSKYIDYHVICTLAKGILSIEPTSLDFGLVDIGSTSGAKILTLKNDGGKSTRFAVDIGPSGMDLSVKPMRGILHPYSKILLRVELIGVEEGSFFGEFWRVSLVSDIRRRYLYLHLMAISTVDILSKSIAYYLNQYSQSVRKMYLTDMLKIKSTPNIQVPVEVNIIIPRLVVYHPNTTGDFTLIDFPPTFTNTTRHDTIIVRSFSAEVSNFVVLGEIDNDLIPIKNINKKKHPAFQVFTIYPLEGRMDPFEGRVFNITFSPTAKVIEETGEFRKRDRQDFMVFVRIFRVHCTEVEDILRNEVSLDDPAEESLKRLQLFEPASIESLAMSDDESSELPRYETVRLCLYGEAEEARLEFVPNELHLGDVTIGEVAHRELTIVNSSSSTSVGWKFLPNAAAHCVPSAGRIESQKSSQVLITVTGNYNVKVPFRLTFDLVVQTCDLTNLKASYTKAKPCWVLVWYKLIIPPTRDNRRKPSSGISSTQVEFQSIHKKNQLALLSVKNDNLWKDLGNEKIMNIKKPPVHHLCVDCRYALSPKKAAFRARHRIYWSDYIRLRRVQKEEIALKRLTDTSSDITDCRDLLTCKLPKIKEESIALKIFGEAMALKVGKHAKDEMLVPLSPLQIYNVKIAPTLLAFGLVAPKSTNYRTLRVENLNDFPVMLRLVSRVSNIISFPNGSLMVLHPGAAITKIVEYRAHRIGKFNTYIDYVINDNHSFAMTITANVVLKSLSLNIRELIFGNQYLPREAYQPLASFVEIKNKLDATTSFFWDLRSSASFLIYPMSGEIRGNRSLFAEVCYEPIASRSDNREAVLTSESGTRTNLKLDVRSKKPDVAFVNDTLNLDRIPLNTTTTVIGVLHNAEFSEVTFQIDPSSLIYGCEVYPHHGVISPRGIINLEVRLKFDACFIFSITIDVLVQNCLKLGLKLIGHVSYPLLKLSPEMISMKRISVDAIATHLLTASNVGNTVLRLQFILEDYPEYRASLSSRRKDPGIDSEGFTISPGATVVVYLHFIPTDLASYSFYLPIVTNEILGPVLIESPKSIKPFNFLKPREAYYVHCPGIKISELPPTIPTVFIECTVSGHVISFSKHIFHFDFVSNKIKEELRVCNESHREVSFVIRIDDFSEPGSPFCITWLSGVEPNFTALSIVCTLQPCEEILFLIEFKPAEQGSFEIEAPIFVKGELEGNMFNSLLLDGINLVSYIVCDVKELYFAPVPLDVGAEQKLTLKVAPRQKPFEIKAGVVEPLKCVGTYSDNCIQVKFLSSNVVGGENSNEKLDISVLFRSKFPVAFRIRIDFIVAGAVACSVNICAIADNCILTTYGFQQGIAKVDRAVKQQERFSFPSITSHLGDSTSLIKQELTIPRKHDEFVLGKFGVHPSMSAVSGVSGISQKSLKILGAKYKTVQNEDQKSGGNENDNSEAVSLKSKLSGPLPPVFDQCSNLSNAVYPYFPIIKANDTDSNMLRTLNATEQWMYSAGFKFNFYPSIVEGITAVLSGVCSVASGSNERRKAHTVDQSFIDLLVSLAGPDVLKYIGDTSLVPKDPDQRVSYVLKLYDDVLKFLAVQGAFLPHVESEFLLSYNDYLLNDLQSEKIPRELFQSRSKQCWLDVALQTFKTLVLGRIGLKNMQDNRNSFSSRRYSSAENIFDHDKKPNAGENPKNISQYTNEETLLLNWLQHHFERQRLEGWMKDDRTYLNPRGKRDVLSSRTVSNFERDLADSLALIAVTAAHCPYLIDDHFRQIFILPRNVEEAHHNAVCLTVAWRRIRLGFMITPGQIAKPNCVQMVMLVAHLYQTLPTFLPSTKIQFCCPLTETVVREVSFNNTTEFPVSYIVEFIGNKMDLFSAVMTQPIVNLKAGSAGSFKIRYHARKIANFEAHVILCGSSVSPYFARNHVFILEGCTSYLGVTNNYDIETMLYKVCDENLNIPVPFDEVTEYDISLTEEQPTVPGYTLNKYSLFRTCLKLSRWADLKTRKVPRRLFLNQKSIVVSKNSYQADLSITIACIAPTKRYFWIVFESEIGDFIIQINSTSKKATTDYIVVEWERETCTCSDLTNGISRTCPLTISVGIPARNVQLWNCVNEMFQKTLDIKERSFWSHHFDTNIGLRLIHWLMGDYNDSAAYEFMHIFDTAVTYRVTTTDKENLIVPVEFAIRDVRLRNEEIYMPVHILQAAPQFYETTIRLSSSDGMEYRTYNINFLCKTPIPSAVISETDNRMKKKNKRR